jgi:DNA-binding CsgD family transcriptional regulator
MTYALQYRYATISLPMPVAHQPADGPLIGRDGELDLVTGLLDRVDQAGRALLLRGDPGIGKSRLLSAAGLLAQDRGMSVLRTSGVQAEAHLGFAGLHQLLRPVRVRVAGLPAAHRAALEAAFGIGADIPPEPFRIAMAVLDLLSELATEAPLLIVVDDAHNLDRPSADVLAFVARRIESDTIVMLIATRDHPPSPLSNAGLEEHRLEPLSPAAAAELVGVSAHQLSPARRALLLGEAAGNPLALIELSKSTGDERSAASIRPLPLTERLEKAFASRVTELPEPAQWLLLAAAVDDQDNLSELLHAAGIALGRAVTASDLQPAVEAAIVELDLQTIRFRHPLMRSAVLQSTTVQRLSRIHEALAETLSAQPDRAIWHVAAPLAGAHETVAAELEAVALRARRRGAVDVAGTALRRAADLSDAGHLTRRLLAAAYVAAELGQPDVVTTLLERVRRARPDALDEARATSIEAKVDSRPLESDERTSALIQAAEHAGQAGDRDLHIELLWHVAVRFIWTDPGEAVRRMLRDASLRLGDARSDDPRVVAIYAYADPRGHAPEVVVRLREALAAGSHDPEPARHFGAAAFIVGAFDLALPFWRTAIDGLRSEGRLGYLPRALTILGTVAARHANWDVALPAADEGRRLGLELGEPMWEAGAATVVSAIAGMRGDHESAAAAAEMAERYGLTAGVHWTVAMAQAGRSLAALGTGRHEEAYNSARRLFDPDDSAYNTVMSAWVIGELAEAAWHIGRVDEAREHLAELDATGAPGAASWIGIGVRHARALLASEDNEALFEEALSADLDGWPFPRARLLLAYGEWLRRERRVADSRAPLRSARDIFDALGCAVWGDRARSELRASGETSRRRDPEARDRLTPQELQIAQLAAEGLTNREIGQRLFLSHRTIATHLYRVFPKLGIAARSQLPQALASDPAPA